MQKPKAKTVFRKIPRFETEDEEREFWMTADSTEYFDWSKAVQADFPNLRPSVAISLRLPGDLLEELKQLASERGVPYQRLLKDFLDDRVRIERERRPRAGWVQAVREQGPPTDFKAAAQANADDREWSW